MTRTSVESEAIRSIGYDGSTLEIEFTNNRIYKYFNVPAHVHAAFMSAESHGSYFNEHIKPIYTNYREVT